MATFKPSRCAAGKCDQVSFVICHCCKQSLCLKHVTEHHNLLDTKISPLVDEVNTLINRLQQPLPNQSAHLATLEQWRLEAHQCVEAYCEAKQKYLLEGYRQKLFGKLAKLRDDLNRMIQQQDYNQGSFDRIQLSLRSNDECIHDIEHARLVVSPLEIKDTHVLLSSDLSSVSKKASSGKTPRDQTHHVASGRVSKVNHRSPSSLGLSSNHNRSNERCSNDWPSLKDKLLAIQNGTRSVEQPRDHPNAPFYVFVQSRMGSCLAIRVRALDTIMMVKNKINSKRTMPVETQRLTFMDKELRDDQTVSSYDISELATLNLSWRT